LKKREGELTKALMVRGIKRVNLGREDFCTQEVSQPKGFRHFIGNFSCGTFGFFGNSENFQVGTFLLF